VRLVAQRAIGPERVPLEEAPDRLAAREEVLVAPVLGGAVGGEDGGGAGVGHVRAGHLDGVGAQARARIGVDEALEHEESVAAVRPELRLAQHVVSPRPPG